eukprot:COSAG02_NODE_2223_length_9455_cov_5.513675_10_plen_300_part_00
MPSAMNNHMICDRIRPAPPPLTNIARLARAQGVARLMACHKSAWGTTTRVDRHARPFGAAIIYDFPARARRTAVRPTSLRQPLTAHARTVQRLPVAISQRQARSNLLQILIMWAASYRHRELLLGQSKICDRLGMGERARWVQHQPPRLANAAEGHRHSTIHSALRVQRLLSCSLSSGRVVCALAARVVQASFLRGPCLRTKSRGNYHSLTLNEYFYLHSPKRIGCERIHTAASSSSSVTSLPSSFFSVGNRLSTSVRHSVSSPVFSSTCEWYSGVFTVDQTALRWHERVVSEDTGEGR